MNSIVALGAFISFILVGFAIEMNGNKKVTNAIWLPFLWMVVCASRSIEKWLSLSDTTTLSEAEYIASNMAGSPIDKVVLSLAILLGLIVIFKRRKRVPGILKDNSALIAFIVYLGITVLWSDETGISFRRWIRLFGNLVMAAVLLTEPYPLQSIRSLFRRTAYLLIPLSVMFIKYFPQKGILYTKLGGLIWTGVAVMKNSLAHLGLVMFFFLLWDMTTNWGKDMRPKKSRLLFDSLILVMSLWLLIGRGITYNSMSVACLMLGIFVLVIFKFPIVRTNYKNIGVMFTLSAVLYIALENWFGITQLVVTALGRNMTFTDRVPLWSSLINVGLQQPLFGYGYEGFWIGKRLYMAEGFSQSHNGYLEIFVEGGIMAIILLVLVLLSVFRKILKGYQMNYEFSILRFSLFIMVLLANVTESSFARERDLLTFVFFIIALDYTLPKKYQTPLRQGLVQAR